MGRKLVASSGKENFDFCSAPPARTIDPDEGFVETRSERSQWLEFLLLCLCTVAWTIDSFILPLFFKEFQELFGVSQTSLSFLSTTKGWAAAISAFPCGFMGEMLPRPRLIGCGMLLWAAGLVVCSASRSFQMLFVGRILNGIGLGAVHPLLLSLVADKNAPTKRGSAYGSIFFTGAICNSLFGLLATSYAAVPIAGIMGWRFSIAMVAIFSALVGVAFLGCVEEPNAQHLKERKRTGFVAVFVENLPKVGQLFKYPTFILILCQGAPGTAPWTILPLFTQWLEMICFSHQETALIYSMFGWGQAFSTLTCGFLMNFLARRWPDHGPPSMADFSVFAGMAFLGIIFSCCPSPRSWGRGTTCCSSIARPSFSWVLDAMLVA